MWNKKISAVLLTGVLLLPLAACNSAKTNTEVTDKRIVLTGMADEKKPETTEIVAPYEFKPLKYTLIRDYFKDGDGDNFPFLAATMLADSDLYQYPDAGSKVISKVKKDDKIYLIQNIANGWSYIHQGDKSGYVKSETTDQNKVKEALAKHKSTAVDNEMTVKPPYDTVVTKDNFKSTGKKEANTVYWKNYTFPFEKVADFSRYNPEIIYNEPASQMIYKMIGPDYSPYDNKLTFLDGHRHKVAFNMWNNKFGKGEIIEITDKDGNAYKYKVVDAVQELFSKYNAYISAAFANGTSVVDALYFGANYEGVVIQYCNDATTDPVINFFLCLPVLDEKA